jgi:hypothetical protein
MKTACKVLSLAWLVVLAAACSAPQPFTPTAIQTQATFPPTPPPTSRPPTATSSFTPSPKPTRTTAFTPTISPPTPSPTPDILQTAMENPPSITELLKTNLGCKLPCWWGIMPGKTTWAETKQFLIRLGGRIGSSPQSDGTIYHGTGGFDFAKNQYTAVFNIFGFSEKNNIVEDIYIRGNGDASPVDFQTAWERYSPHQVMADYGAPSRVWMYTDSMDYGDRTGYSLWLAYDSLGFLIRYEGFVQQRDQPIYRICPRFDHGMDIQEMVIVLQSPDNPRPLEEMDPLYPHSVQYIHTLEDATGLTVEEFYKLFTQDKKPACFNTPKNIWPSSFP